jgi:DNA primase
METAIFLKEALPESGSYCVFASNTSADRRSQQFFDSVDDVVDVAQDLDTKGYDVYFALASFKEAKSRKVDNVQHLKSFFLDLDCGPSKDFVSQTEALAQLKMFCKQLQLPRPLLINSGRGIHVYWVLSEAVPLDDWLPVALRLKQLCAENNFLADPAVTADAARVLRIPRTHNYKPEIPAEVDFVGTHLPTLVDFDLFSRLLGNDLIPVTRFGRKRKRRTDLP